MSLFQRAILWIALVAGVVVPAAAADSIAGKTVNVLVFSDDADEDTIPRDNRIYNRVIVQIQEALNLRGFQVFDETATSQTFTETHKVRRVDAEVLEIARSVTPRINVAVVFQIYASVVQSEFGTLQRPKVRISGRMLNVFSGQFIGSFEVKDFPLAPLPKSCEDRDCLLEHIGDYSADLGNALGETLADKLEAWVTTDQQQAADAAPAPAADTPATQPAPVAQPANGCTGMPDTFIIRFKEFDDQQINQFEQLLASFGCYTHHAAVTSRRNFIEFTYDTSSGDARLARNLRLLLDYAEVKGTVSQTGNIFEVQQIRTR